MRIVVPLTATVFLATHPPAFADQTSPVSFQESLPSVQIDRSAQLRRAITLEIIRASTPQRFVHFRSQAAEAASTERRSWCKRHLVACGVIIGIPTGFLIGVWTNGDRDYDAAANGLIYAGVGAGVGAATGGIIAAGRK
jgi:hypothetical protein